MLSKDGDRSVSLASDPQRWTNIPLLVKIFKLIVNELSSVVEANANRANPADWSQGTGIRGVGFMCYVIGREVLINKKQCEFRNVCLYCRLWGNVG